MLCFYIGYSVVALTTYAKLFCFKKQFEFQEMLVFIILHITMAYVILKVFMV